MFRAYISLGSNLGNSKEHLHSARVLIEEKAGKIQRCSSLYQTQAWGKEDQPDFLNQVIQIDTILEPAALLSCILSIEAEIGRKRHEKWGSRLIDLDILFYEDRVINEAELIVPHPFLHKRRFCLMPLCEIAPDLIHPVCAASLADLLYQLDDDLFVKKIL